MTPLVRALLSLVGLAGASSAVAVPLSLNSQLQEDNFSPQSSGGGSEQISLNRCESLDRQNNTPVGFGNGQINDVCGNLDSREKDLKHTEEYSKLLGEHGGDKERDGNKNNDHSRGQQQCDGSSSPGVVFGTQSGEQYLGGCSESSSENSFFIKKRKGGTKIEDVDKGMLGACDNDCGTNDSNTIRGNTTVLEKEKTENGREINFYQKEKIGVLKQEI